MSDKERKVIEDTVAHWERMIAWAEKQGDTWAWSKEFGHNQNMKDMYQAIGETAGSPCCPLCQTYKTCASCPLFVRFGRCNDSGGNLYPALEKCTSWFQWAKAARAFLEQIRSLLPKEIDWTKPIRFVNGIEPGIVRNDLRVVERHELGNTLRTVCYVDKYGRNGVSERIIENVTEEPEYISLEIGDRLTINDSEYMVVMPGGYCSLINMSTGRSRAACVKTKDGGRITLSVFKAALGSRAGQWQEIYKTVRRRQG